jgi:iron-sulfur cluster assembly protein
MKKDSLYYTLLDGLTAPFLYDIMYHNGVNQAERTDRSMTLPEQTQTEVIAEAISITPAAANAVQDLITRKKLDDYALRVYISGGGCSGFQYGMALEGNIRPTDLVVNQHGVKVVVDEISIEYLRGANIDYVDEVMGSGFKIENPNAVSTCGCGSSFRTAGSEDHASSGGCGCH